VENKKPEFLTPAQVVERWNNAVTTGTLANWRCRSIGPDFQKFGSRVRYPLAAIEAYERAHAVHANDNQKKADAA
jgi:hypothetical protein